MAKLFSVASWYVEHFKGDGPDRRGWIGWSRSWPNRNPTFSACSRLKAKPCLETLVQRHAQLYLPDHRGAADTGNPDRRKAHNDLSLITQRTR